MTAPNKDKTACQHKNAERERGRWGSTGDYICHECGEIFTSKAEMEAAQSLRPKIPTGKKKKE